MGQPLDNPHQRKSNFDAISGALFGVSFCRHLRVAGIKTTNLIVPHLHKVTGSQIVDGLPNVFDIRKCIFPDRSLTPLLLFSFFFALIGGAH